MSPDELIQHGLDYARRHGLHPLPRRNRVVSGVFRAGNSDAAQLEDHLFGLVKAHCPGLSGGVFQAVIERVCALRQQEEPPPFWQRFLAKVRRSWRFLSFS
jgi:hypothetical protein